MLSREGVCLDVCKIGGTSNALAVCVLTPFKIRGSGKTSMELMFCGGMPRTGPVRQGTRRSVRHVARCCSWIGDAVEPWEGESGKNGYELDSIKW